MTHDDLKTLLTDYMAPVPDNGFSARVLEAANKEAARVVKLRARVINAAFFIGGAVAAIQVPKAADLISSAYSTAKDNMSAAPLSDSQNIVGDMMASSPSYLWIAMLCVFVLLLWAVIDNEGGLEI